MTGGGNNLGVVTKIDCTAIAQPAVWGGLNVYLENLNNLAEAIAQFELNNQDLKAVIGVIYAYDPSQGGLFATFFAPSVVRIYWLDESQDQWFHDTLMEINDNVANCAASADGGPVLPPDVMLYPNYAAFDTPTSSLFGPNLPRSREIQIKYDPNGATKLTSGWEF
ncbi:hypothetical protein VNI00_010068 [Paramarasmius palmivorus]|uniref:Uncharacterized protein n=1 Tax=Paramarasmius palmivorus TaxID=297713 RepID=A0AAW0CJS4_9AGAR